MKIKKIASLILAAVMLLSSFPASFAEEVIENQEISMSDAEAVKTVYDEFSKAEYGKTSSPLLFPVKYNGEEYTNVISYLKAWAYDKTGHNISVKFTPYIYTTTYKDWSSGTLKETTYDGMDLNGDILQDYFTNNAKKTLNRLDNVSFSSGDAVSESINKIYVPISSLERTPREIVDYAAKQFPFARIKNTNSSEDEIIAALGEKSGSTVALPTACGLYGTTSINVVWSAKNISGSESALKISGAKTTVTRPNVGEDDAVFDLTAKITSKEDTDETAETVHRITVPAFQEAAIEIVVPKDAKIKIKDSYYNAFVNDKYIQKQDTQDDEYDFYVCSLHAAAAGGAQKYTISVSKDGYITKNVTISVEKSTDEPYRFELVESGENDTRLKSLEILSGNASAIDFDMNKEIYETEASGQYITINAEAATEGATVKVSSYYSSLANANKKKTSAKDMPSSGLKCYLPDAVGENEIIITVAPPEGSKESTREYKLIVKKVSENGALTSLVLKAISESDAQVDKNADKCAGVMAEETLLPSFVPGMGEKEYVYSVNYGKNKIAVTVKADSKYTLSLNGSEIKSNTQSAPIDLNVGDNDLVITASCGDKVEKYEIKVRRKAPLYITGIELDGKCTTDLSEGKRTAECIYDHDADNLNLKITTNTDDICDVSVLVGDVRYSGISGEKIEIPIGDKDSLIAYICISHNVDSVVEGQTYVVGFDRGKSTGPDAVESYLPAPGQFVNLKSSWGNPEQTLSGSSGITLGAFGGNVIYRYDTPIKNDPKNPYGIDFIIFGNCFTDSDGGTSSGAAEPAAVEVSRDGVNWYELAGSEYYAKGAEKCVSVTYENTDVSFEEAVEVPWISSNGEEGKMPVVSQHPQNYFPNPAYYGKYQTGIGKNTTYSTESVTFSGTMIEYGFYPFGYADSHSANPEFKNRAQNPYVENHRLNYNGDGFDIAWAVDKDGNPVTLDEISYIKIYNPVMSYGSARGEISPEIQSVSIAEPAENDVGKSCGLKKLFVNGKEIELSDGIFTYNADAENAATVKITPVAENADANIYVSNRRVESNTESAPIESVEKLRIIVQEDEKEPIIYIINFSNVPIDVQSAELLSLKLLPGDVKITPDENGALSFSVSSEVSAVRFTPETLDKKATVDFSENGALKAEGVPNGETSVPISVSTGNNEFKVKVSSGDEEKEYNVTVIRAKSGGTQNKITVKFSLVGDIVHYNDTDGSQSGSHTPKNWISQKSVSVPKGSTVKYLTELLLNNAGIDYKSDGIYVSEIDGLAEFDNGPNSGWMYRVNGTISEEGYAEKILGEGDVVKWFYTDDYTKESGYEGGWDSVNSGGGSHAGTSVSGKTEANKETQTEDEKKDIPFADIKGHWAEAAISYVFEKSLMVGTDEVYFEPDTFMTRAMLASVLFRIEQAPQDAYKNVFSDVPENEWYSTSVLWAAENKIVGGMGDGRFAPNDTLTREQLAVMIMNYMKFKGIEFEKLQSLESFSDESSVSEWAKDSVIGACGMGIISGTDENKIEPQKNATRGQVAVILMRCCEVLNKRSN